MSFIIASIGLIIDPAEFKVSLCRFLLSLTGGDTELFTTSQQLHLNLDSNLTLSDSHWLISVFTKRLWICFFSRLRPSLLGSTEIQRLRIRRYTFIWSWILLSVQITATLEQNSWYHGDISRKECEALILSETQVD